MFPKRSNTIAIVAGDLQINYNQLVDKTRYFASQLKVNPKERVLIFSENRLEWIYAFYACWQIGVVPVPVDFMLGVEDLTFIINDSQPTSIYCSLLRLPILKEALKNCEKQPKIEVFEDFKIETISEVFNSEFVYNSQNIAVIIYTSGTTGSPKGVMLTFDNLMANIEGVTIDVEIFRSVERVMLLLPLHHIFPLVGSLIAPISVGGMVALAPSLASEDILKTLCANKITILIGVPRFYSIIRKGIKEKIKKSIAARILFGLAKLVKSKTFSRTIFKTVHQKFGGHVRYMVSGGAALDPETALDFITLGFDILEGYGMTEAAPMITFTRPGKFRSGSAGQPLPATKVEVHDGEIVASGRNIMAGYYNRITETNDILYDHWLHTGDLGYIDKDGYIFITGRKKEIIVLSNGKNVNPEPIEQHLILMDAFINEAGVFIMHDILQVILVVDLLKMKYAGISNYDEYFRSKVIEKYNRDATPYKRVLKFYISTEELPKTRLGKLQRFKLAELASNYTIDKRSEVTEPTYREYQAIKEFLENETGNKIFPTDHLEMDVALDSLSKVTLLVYIENAFGLKIPEEEFLKYHTVVNLAEFVRDTKTKSTLEGVNWSAILKEKVHMNLPNTSFMLAWINTFSKVALNIYFRMRGEGMANIPDGPCIIAPNHQSFFDGFFVASFLKKKTMDKTYIYAKEKHWRRSWQQFIANRNNIIIMDINKDLKTSLQKMAELLKKGKNIIIFPEGTRTTDGNLGQFKKTFAILSQELNVPVVPVAISGSYKALPTGAWFPRPFRKIRVQFLQPVYPANHSYDSLKDLVQSRVAGKL